MAHRTCAIRINLPNSLRSPRTHLLPPAVARLINKVRTRLSLEKDAPKSRRARPVGNIAALPVLGGLHHQYVRVRVFGSHNY
jgi:hypothetical protein